MQAKFFWSVARIGALALLLGAGAFAQNANSMKLRGVINDYTPANLSGPWEVRGQWSLEVKGDSGKADFNASVTMERSDQGIIMNGGGDFITPAGRHAHTHHVILVNGDVTPLANGFRVTGTAIVSGNGGQAPDFTLLSPVQIDITGGSVVQLSNIKLSFSGPASTHLGTQPYSGVVRNGD